MLLEVNSFRHEACPEGGAIRAVRTTLVSRQNKGLPRLVLGVCFLLSFWGKLLGYSDFAAWMESMGIPKAMGAAAVVEVVEGVCAIGLLTSSWPTLTRLLSGGALLVYSGATILAWPKLAHGCECWGVIHPLNTTPAHLLLLVVMVGCWLLQPTVAAGAAGHRPLRSVGALGATTLVIGAVVFGAYVDSRPAGLGVDDIYAYSIEEGETMPLLVSLPGPILYVSEECPKCRETLTLLQGMVTPQAGIDVVAVTGRIAPDAEQARKTSMLGDEFGLQTEGGAFVFLDCWGRGFALRQVPALVWKGSNGRWLITYKVSEWSLRRALERSDNGRP